MPENHDPKLPAAAPAWRPPPGAPQRELVKLSLLLCPRSDEEPRRGDG